MKFCKHCTDFVNVKGKYFCKIPDYTPKSTTVLWSERHEDDEACKLFKQRYFKKK